MFLSGANQDTIVTMKRADFEDPNEYDLLASATDVDGNKYKMIHLPLTDKTINGWKGIYINYYIGNSVVIVPIYDDPADNEAKQIISSLYPNREVVGIKMIELFKDGGMAHCITQQQPMFIVHGTFDLSVSSGSGVLFIAKLCTMFLLKTMKNVCNDQCSRHL